MPAPKPRWVDERELEMLRLREAGVTTKEVGRTMGMREERVRVVTNRIRAEYVASSGDKAGWW